MTTLITASLIAFGLFGYRLLAVAALPAVDFPTIQITATLPGASPETMGASVAGPIERALSTIAGITSLTSTSALGISSIVIQFDLNRNIDGAALDVQSALTVAARRLPIEMVTPPSFRKVNPADQPIIQFSLVSSTLPMSKVDDYGEITLAQQISQLHGRRPGSGVRGAEIRRARPGRSGRRRIARHLHGRCAHRPRQEQFEHAGRLHLRNRGQAEHDPRRIGGDAHRRRIPQRHRRLPQWRADQAQRNRQRGR